jgi:lipopolysaccharide export system protein LptA
MPVPVPPPEIPVRLESVVINTTENPANPSFTPSVVKPKKLNVTPPSEVAAQPVRPPLSEGAKESIAVAQPEVLSSPERFAPEYSVSPSTSGTAAMLGSPISVGLPSSQPSPPPPPTSASSFRDRRSALERSAPLKQDSVTAPPKRLVQLIVPSLTEGRSPDGSYRARLIARERADDTHEEYDLSVPAAEPPPPESPGPQPFPPVEIDPEDIVELTSDYQEYDAKRGIVTARGNAVMRFSKGVLSADRIQVNLRNRVTVAEGDVALKRGDQILRGERFEYFFVQDRGVIENASGEIYQPTVGRDVAPTVGDSTVLGRPLSDRLLVEQPVQGVSATEGYQFTVGGVGNNTQGTTFPTSGSTGQLNRQRFEAARVEFDGEVWRGRDVRVTNDPFSPPELEVRADTAEFRNIGPLQDELVLYNPRLVFDQGLALPLFPRRFVFDRRDREPALFTIGYDEDERGGVFIERSFDIYTSDRVRFQLTPQYLIQRSILDGEGFKPETFGLRGALDIRFSDRAYLDAKAALSSLALDNYQNRLRLNAKFNQQVDIFNYPHALTVEANYRDRLFNGSLGFQTVQSSFGAILTSPTIALGDTGLLLNYQAGVQRIEADTDRLDLLPPMRDNNRVTLTRYQGVALLTRYFPLWVGEPLPATPDAGLRYTPVPVVPNVQLTTQLTGVSSYYSSGDTQPSITGSIGISGQIGHFSRPLLDYTGFNVTYTEGIRGAASPFLFDRFVDTRTLSFGLTQQVYGPFRLGFQSSVNLNTGQEISTDYILEYSRRTHNIILRYNPVLGLAAIGLRISDFNWNGSPQPFEGSGVRAVEQGVIR